MKKQIVMLLLAWVAMPAWAVLNVFATVPEWGALAKEIGGDKLNIYVATTALQDPHRIEARPSLLAQARRAQLLLATGAELEVGWLPLVVRDSGNSAIQNGRPGYFEAVRFVAMRDVPVVLDRAHGDVHAAGNPHIHLDPRNILKVGVGLTARLAEIDPSNAEAYRANFKVFADKWQLAMTRWDKEAASLRGVPVLSHHTSFVYLAAWLGLNELGMLEPKPGVEPTSGHLSALIERQASKPARMVLRAAYQSEGPSQWIAKKAGIPAIMLPFTVGGTAGAGDLFGLFDDTIQRLLQAKS
ncbi:MAG: zinc ABC transporter substrate-binding protein [Rhodocyclaceae bacterium]|nr:zinc ABC transporter substrate-binding protein [Rhodocyclaceae bacterium]